ncbi:hypothetical protein PTTG_12396 [Puccinia triticina 1-1 BBBD Race 1]|uniref:Uncharacterized protein n=2 Tax=Puccinia triticina TaxID=208348 RepID=A0A180GGA9_PUCT1|nr:uncharacterized protein PtA15_4A554 [Puccinia triticina]OAV91003.1 hypothetical protein PTTG_12396 [Puccinia triticina 1-1 BBBD Race 1]WAQ84103.1 hypothetical protein PtA15_4A554 [Puccinia triticina]WAR54934.1 hypothetical protein PtB15_4B552 [Puccinia triticina]
MASRGSGPIPAGVNPFALQVAQFTSQLFSEFSGFTKGLLIFLFICHLVVAVFCSVILVLPYVHGIKRSQWIFRRLYIKNRPGQSAQLYKAPLFWLNAGVVMTMSQLLGSVATLAYIIDWFKIASTVGRPSATLTEPAIGLMFMCEMLTYWSLMHCFVVTIYYDHETQAEDIAQEFRKWTPSPTFINVLFLGFPMVIIIATVSVFGVMSVFHAELVHQATDMLEILKEGASVWDQLKVPTTSVSEKYQLVTQLTEVVSGAKSTGDQIQQRVTRSVKFIRILLSIILALISVTFVCFIGVSSIVVMKFHQQQVRSRRESCKPNPFRQWFRPKDWPSASEEQNSSNTRKLVNRQFFHLLIRAVFIIVSMITSMTLFGLWVTRTGDFISSPYWRGVTSWVSTLACTWSSIPIAWQCYCHRDTCRKPGGYPDPRKKRKQTKWAIHKSNTTQICEILHEGGKRRADPACFLKVYDPCGQRLVLIKLLVALAPRAASFLLQWDP